MSSLFKVNQVFTVNKLHYEAKTGHYKIDLLNKHGESLNKNLKKLLKKVENNGAEWNITNYNFKIQILRKLS